MTPNFLKKGYAKKERGFTLIELLIALAIGASVIGLIASVFTTLSRNRLQYQAEAEVETEGNEVMNIITQTIRLANAINAPATSSSAASLSVNVPSSISNPIVFSISSSSIQLLQGTIPYLITGSSTKASALLFSNLSASSTAGVIRTQFTLSQNSYKQTFYSSAALHFFRQ